MIFNRLVAYSTLSNAYVSRFGDFCAHNNDNNDDRTDYFTPCTCTQGNKAKLILCPEIYNVELIKANNQIAIAEMKVCIKRKDRGA